VILVDDLAALDSPAALAFEALPERLATFRERESLRLFTPVLRTDQWSVVLAESSDDTWWEAAEGSYQQYRDALRLELEARCLPVRSRALTTARIPWPDLLR